MLAAYQYKIKHAFHTLITLLCLMMPSYTYAADILVTLPPLAGLVQWIDPEADVQCLLPAHADPHHFQLSPRQVEALQHAKLLLRSSQDDAFWSGLSSHINTIDIWPLQKHLHPSHNHAWLNPKEVELVLPNIAKALIQIYPEHKKNIQLHLQQDQDEIHPIWSAWQQVTQHIKKHGVILQHPSWRNLFQALNIPIVDVLESEQHGHEYGPHKLEHALGQLNHQPNVMMIADKNHSNRALQWLKQHHPKSQIIQLDALGTCQQTWIELMHHNIKLLRTASENISSQP